MPYKQKLKAPISLKPRKKSVYKIVQYIKDKGTVYAFHKKYGYGKRALVEAQISRIKRCIGNSLLTQKIESQKNEGIIIINKWNTFGRCVSVKIG